MPTATSFSTRGKSGSGFPNCIERVDVSLYDYSNPMTLEQAGQLFYNLYAINIAPATLTNRKVVVSPASDEIIDFTTIYDPAPPLGTGETAPVSVTPFKIGTLHLEYTAPPASLSNASNYSTVEPWQRVCAAKIASRTVYQTSNVDTVLAELRFTSLKALYNGDTSDDANLVGYGFPMGCLTMASGVTLLSVNQMSIGNYAQLTNWVDPGLPGFPLTNWWDEMGIWYGALYTTPAPNTVAPVDIDGIPFIQAQWIGLDAAFSSAYTTATWTVPTPNDEFGAADLFEFYTYA